jgi:hypothetical protein
MRKKKHFFLFCITSCSYIAFLYGCLPSSLAYPPENLICTTLSTTSIQCNWTDYSDNETGFIVERKKGNTINFEKIVTVGPDIVVYEDTLCDPGTQYYYRVCAAMSSGDNTGYSNTDQAVTNSMIEAQIDPNDPDVVFENPAYTHTYRIYAYVSSDTEPGKWTYNGSTYVYIGGDPVADPIGVLAGEFAGFNYGQFAIKVNNSLSWYKFSTRNGSDDTQEFICGSTVPWYGAMADETGAWSDNEGYCTFSITDITE